jgi:hypothetical protein
VLKQLVNNVLKNPFIWGMALTYFFIYIVRQVRGRGEGQGVWGMLSGGAVLLTIGQCGPLYCTE